MPKSRSKRQKHQPPPKAKPKQSPVWVGGLFFTLMGAGVLVIIAHYLGLLPGGTQPYQLWVGLGLIAAAFVVATQWH
jgi:hypothetical protein